jgi:CRISPR-associated protein Csm2
MAYYHDEKGNIKPEWVVQEAEEAAKKFFVMRFNRYKNAEEADPNKSIKNSQLRKFYGEFKKLEAEVNQAGDSADERFLSVLPRIKIAAAKVTYAKARGVVPETFVTWMTTHCGQINSLEDFKAFLLHFEAVVGYCYGINPKD